MQLAQQPAAAPAAWPMEWTVHLLCMMCGESVASQKQPS